MVLKTTTWAWLVWFTVTLFATYQFLIQMSFSVLQAPIKHDLGLSGGTVSLVAALYAITLGIMQIPVGLMLDRISSRRLITLASAALALGCALFGLAHTVPLVAAGWILAGIGSAFAFVSAAYLIRAWFPRRRFALVLGLTQGVSAVVGAGFGTVLVSDLLRRHSWNEILLIASGMGLLVVLLAATVIRQRPPMEELSGDHSPPKSKPRRSVFQSLDEVFDRPQILLVALFAGTTFGNLVGFGGLWNVTWEDAGWGHALPDAAELNAMLWIGFGIGAVVIGWFSDWIGRRQLVAFWGAMLALVANVFLVILPFHYAPWFLFAVIFVQGFAWGVSPLCYALVCENAPRRVHGIGMAIVNMVAFLFGSLLQLTPGVILGSVAEPSRLELRNALLPFVIISVLAVVISGLLIRETRCEPLLDESDWRSGIKSRASSFKP
ncbi:L-galactonate transporter [Planctomycetes bacterium Pan216]|uniref:Lysosomal dipeptide transporter MFSD1 n=1 Tax=Kolteria novifilia TaxID=2527975 RepID=A0A518B4J0_9BACT|nr:L-galactonate transporter [Planctomycetes bacterium Pan216]